MTRKRKTESDLIEANFASNEYARNKKADRKSGFVSTCKKLNPTCKSFWQVVWLEFLRLARCAAQHDKERQICQSKKSNTIRKRAMRQAEKLKDDKKATMTQGINLALCFCLLCLCFLKKRFNRHESGSKNDITIRL